MSIAVVAAAACLSIVGLSSADDAKASMRVPTQIPAQSLGTALKTFAQARDIQVLYFSEAVKDIRTGGAVGELTTDEALSQLLSGTGLTYRYVSDKAITILPSSEASAPGAAAGQPASAPANSAPGEGAKEGKKSSSGGFLLAQLDQGAVGPSSVDKVEPDQAESKKKLVLEEIVVTGSRFHQTVADSPQKVDVYTREAIEHSGQTTVSDFLNTLPQVSVVMDQVGFQQPGTSVRLHGLPLGTTLVLIDGHRVALPGGNAAASNIFDLSNIPITAVERIDVVPVGSSAIYGSDGIAGVVNIILKRNFSGFEGSVKYGTASGTDSTTTSLAWGSQWSTGSISIVGSYMNTSELVGADRALPANGDYTRFGGSDTRYDVANPGNVYSIDGNNLPGLNAPYAAVPAGFRGTPTQAEFAATAGTLNKFSLYSTYGLIPYSYQSGILMSAHQDLTPSVQLFGQLLYSKRHQFADTTPPFLYGAPGFQQFTVAASNPFNPFGQTVGVSYLFSDHRGGNDTDNTFVQPTLGLRGSFLLKWNWEFSGSWSDQSVRVTFPNQNTGTATAIQNALNSSNPVTALNPFVAGSPGSPQLLSPLFYQITQSYRPRRGDLNAFVNGPLFSLPAGDVEWLLGIEYLRDKLSSSLYDPTSLTPANPLGTDSPTVDRNTSAAFAESRVPLLAKRANGADSLVISLATRYDRYSDIGGKTTPQFGMHWRPLDTLVIRATWGKAFKAPSLVQLHQVQSTSPALLIDPATNQQVVVPVTTGGNPKLQPELGKSSSFGVVYESAMIRGLELGVSQWHIEETDSIQNLAPQTILNYAGLFPGAVTRAPSCASGPPCPITDLQAGSSNFGDIDVQGIDYDASYAFRSMWGDWRVSVNAAQIYRYTASFQPGLPATNRLSIANDSDQDWAPRWKGTVALGWSGGPFAAGVTGRYTGKYQDYEPLTDGLLQTLGNFWLFDFNARLDIGKAFNQSGTWLRNAFLDVGGLNIFDRPPQYSSFYFGTGPGYDALQADIRGRFLYAQLGIKL